ncbi:MAG: hypothetical protein ACYDAQ_19625 [Mycobacteriales bacterium]
MKPPAPDVRPAWVLAGVVLAGLVAIAIGWRGAAATLYVGLQLPFVLSAVFGGIALVGTGAALFNIHSERRAAAARRAVLDDLVRDAAALADRVRRQRGLARS